MSLRRRNDRYILRMYPKCGEIRDGRVVSQFELLEINRP